jgi:FkbM family methyltransferase
MALGAVTTAGRIADALLPPAASMRLRALMRRRDPYGHLAPPPLLSSLIAPGRLAIDVGAHRGLWSYRMSGRASMVHAFEPNPELYHYLSRTHIRSAQTYALALSDSEGSAVLSMMPDGRGTGRATLTTSAASTELATVETRRLDSFSFTDVGFMKVDVEGHEEAVLRGARDTLLQSHPVLFIEIEERHNPGAVTRIPAMLGDLGYPHTYYLHRGRLLPIESFNLETNQLKVEPVTSPDYVNNFVFTDRPLAL